MEEVEYVVITAGSFDLLAEVLCESDDHLLEILSDRIRVDRGREGHRDVRVPQAGQADLLVGRPLSLWAPDSAGDAGTARPPLPGSTDVDVVIVGAGYTGLWTAYYLAAADPSLRIVVLEARTAGFGASGRNGGWCSALFPASAADSPRCPASSRDGAVAMHRAMRRTVDEVGRVTVAEGIDCHYHKGGTVVLARTRDTVGPRASRRSRRPGPGARDDDLRLLDARETAEQRPRDERARRRRTRRTAPRSTRCGWPAVWPRPCERRGVTDPREHPGDRARTRPGDHAVRRWCGADVVVRATEGFTPRLPGYRRAVAPVYSLMVATEPLSDTVWDRIGLADRPDVQRLPAPDHLRPANRGRPARIRWPRGAVPLRIPDPAGVRPTSLGCTPRYATRPASCSRPRRRTVHARLGWSARASPRDWCASVGLDRGTGLAWAGGYVGDGVSTTNLAGRTLADLVLRRDTELVRLPWVGHRSRRVGAGAAALARRERRPARDDTGRHRGADHPPGEPDRPSDGPADRRRPTPGRSVTPNPFIGPL